MRPRYSCGLESRAGCSQAVPGDMRGGIHRNRAGTGGNTALDIDAAAGKTDGPARRGHQIGIGGNLQMTGKCRGNVGEPGIRQFLRRNRGGLDGRVGQGRVHVKPAGERHGRAGQGQIVDAAQDKGAGHGHGQCIVTGGGALTQRTLTIARRHPGIKISVQNIGRGGKRDGPRVVPLAIPLLGRDAGQQRGEECLCGRSAPMGVRQLVNSRDSDVGVQRIGMSHINDSAIRRQQPCWGDRPVGILHRTAAHIDGRTLAQDDLAIAGSRQRDIAARGEQLIDGARRAGGIAGQIGQRRPDPACAVQAAALAQIDGERLAPQRAIALQGLVGKLIAEGFEGQKIVRHRTRHIQQARHVDGGAGCQIDSGGIGDRKGFPDIVGIDTRAIGNTEAGERNLGAGRLDQGSRFDIDRHAPHFHRARGEILDRAVGNGFAIVVRQNLDAAARQGQLQPCIQKDLAVAGDAAIGLNDPRPAAGRRPVGHKIAIEDDNPAVGGDQTAVGDFAGRGYLRGSRTVGPPDDRITVGDFPAKGRSRALDRIDAHVAKRAGGIGRFSRWGTVGIGIGDQLHRLRRHHQGFARGRADGAAVFHIGREQIDKTAGIGRYRARRQIGGDFCSRLDRDIALDLRVGGIVGKAFGRNGAAAAQDAGVEEEAVALGRRHGRRADVQRRGNQGMDIDLGGGAEHHAIGIDHIDAAGGFDTAQNHRRRGDKARTAGIARAGDDTIEHRPVRIALLVEHQLLALVEVEALPGQKRVGGRLLHGCRGAGRILVQRIGIDPLRGIAVARIEPRQRGTVPGTARQGRIRQGELAAGAGGGLRRGHVAEIGGGAGQIGGRQGQLGLQRRTGRQRGLPGLAAACRTGCAPQRRRRQQRTEIGGRCRREHRGGQQRDRGHARAGRARESQGSMSE